MEAGHGGSARDFVRTVQLNGESRQVQTPRGKVHWRRMRGTGGDGEEMLRKRRVLKNQLHIFSMAPGRHQTGTGAGAGDSFRNRALADIRAAGAGIRGSCRGQMRTGQLHQEASVQTQQQNPGKATAMRQQTTHR
ncbi:MAG: hypothetical protein CME04_07405 [Gemmatimonadaceae bacterium]|nr:hypothetical protein [Gemmatimonadaceae bacterium]